MITLFTRDIMAKMAESDITVVSIFDFANEAANVWPCKERPSVDLFYLLLCSIYDSMVNLHDMLAHIQPQQLQIFSLWTPILGNSPPIVNGRASISAPMSVCAERLEWINSLSSFRVRFRFLVNDPIGPVGVRLVVSNNRGFHSFAWPTCAARVFLENRHEFESVERQSIETKCSEKHLSVIYRFQCIVFFAN